MKKLILILVVVLIIGGGAALVVARWVPVDEPVAGQGGAAFPALRGTNLRFESLNVPTDLVGTARLLVVAYSRDQQVFVDKWLLPLERLRQQYPDLMGYYIPLLPADTADAALPILGGMTVAARNDADRARTIVVFTDVAAFNTLVGVEDITEIQLFLLDADGQIRWHGVGNYDPATLRALEAALQAGL